MIKYSKDVYVVSDTFGTNALMPYATSLLGVFYTEEDAWHSIEIAMNFFINERDDNDEIVYRDPIIHIAPDIKVVKVVIPIVCDYDSIINRYHEYFIIKTAITEFEND